MEIVESDIYQIIEFRADEKQYMAYNMACVGCTYVGPSRGYREGWDREPKDKLMQAIYRAALFSIGKDWPEYGFCSSSCMVRWANLHPELIVMELASTDV